MECFVVTRSFSVDTSTLGESEIRSQAEQNAAEWGGNLYTITKDRLWLFPVLDKGISVYFIVKKADREEIQRMMDDGEIPKDKHRNWKKLLDGEQSWSEPPSFRRSSSTGRAPVL